MRRLFIIPRMFLVASLVLASLCSPAQSASLLQFDFNGANPWSQATADVMPSTPLDIATTLRVTNVGTPDATKPGQPTGGLLLGADIGDVNLNWSAIFASGYLPITNAETDLDKLRLEFNLSSSSASPITLQMESFDAKKRSTGVLETIITPKMAGGYEHYEIDLAALKPVGKGKFSPTDPFLQITLIMSGPAWKDKASHRIALDDLDYTATREVTSGH